MPRHFLNFWKKKRFLDLLRIFYVFINMGPHGSQNFKTLLLPQITFDLFKLCLKFNHLSCPHKSTVLYFEILSLPFSRFFFSFWLTWDPMGVKTSKPYSSLRSLFKLFKRVMKFLLSCRHKNTVLNCWNLEFTIFHDFLKFIIIPYEETKNPNHLEKERLGAKRGEIWASGLSVQSIEVTLDS